MIRNSNLKLLYFIVFIFFEVNRTLTNDPFHLEEKEILLSILDSETSSFERKVLIIRGWKRPALRSQVRPTRNAFPSVMYLQLPREDINERHESTNQETIDINILWPARGFRGCNCMKKMAGRKSAITHISSFPRLLYLPALLYFSFDSKSATLPFKRREMASVQPGPKTVAITNTSDEHVCNNREPDKLEIDPQLDTRRIIQNRLWKRMDNLLRTVTFS